MHVQIIQSRACSKIFRAHFYSCSFYLTYIYICICIELYRYILASQAHPEKYRRVSFAFLAPCFPGGLRMFPVAILLVAASLGSGSCLPEVHQCEEISMLNLATGRVNRTGWANQAKDGKCTKVDAHGTTKIQHPQVRRPTTSTSNIGDGDIPATSLHDYQSTASAWKMCDYYLWRRQALQAYKHSGSGGVT